MDSEAVMAFEMDDLCENFKGELSLNGSLNFDQDGEMRYFGPTSGRLQFRDFSSSVANDNGQVPGAGLFEPDPVFDNINIEEYLKPTIFDHAINGFGVAKALQDHLIDLYFTWEQPWYPVVDEKLFRGSLSSGGRYWSALLHNSILALGSRFLVDSLDVRSDANDPNTAGKPFLEQAKALLYAEMEHPSLTTLQALGIIGMVYFVCCLFLYISSYGVNLCGIRQWVQMQLDGCTTEWPIDYVLTWG